MSRDTYGDSYGVVVMITDATSEEKVLEQSLMLEKNEHMTYQLVQTLSKTIEAKDKYTKGHSPEATETACPRMWFVVRSSGAAASSLTLSLWI